MPEDKANAALNNPQMKKFFSAQPFFVQECIMQTGVGGKHRNRAEAVRGKSLQKAAG